MYPCKLLIANQRLRPNPLGYVVPQPRLQESPSALPFPCQGEAVSNGLLRLYKPLCDLLAGFPIE